jgi:hypothetical protein
MRPVPIPDSVAGRRVILDDPGNPADEGAPTPCEYLVTPTTGRRHLPMRTTRHPRRR